MNRFKANMSDIEKNIVSFLGNRCIGCIELTQVENNDPEVEKLFKVKTQIRISDNLQCDPIPDMMLEIKRPTIIPVPPRKKRKKKKTSRKK